MHTHAQKLSSLVWDGNKRASRGCMWHTVRENSLEIDSPLLVSRFLSKNHQSMQWAVIRILDWLVCRSFIFWAPSTGKRAQINKERAGYESEMGASTKDAICSGVTIFKSPPCRANASKQPLPSKHVTRKVTMNWVSWVGVLKRVQRSTKKWLKLSNKSNNEWKVEVMNIFKYLCNWAN